MMFSRHNCKIHLKSLKISRCLLPQPSKKSAWKSNEKKPTKSRVQLKLQNTHQTNWQIWNKIFGNVKYVIFCKLQIMTNPRLSTNLFLLIFFIVLFACDHFSTKIFNLIFACFQEKTNNNFPEYGKIQKNRIWFSAVNKKMWFETVKPQK